MRYIMAHSSLIVRCADQQSLLRASCVVSPSPFQCRAHRLGPGDDELYQRTTVSIMQKEPGASIMIHGYSTRGFNIDDNKVYGPCALLPPAILQWNVRTGF